MAEIYIDKQTLRILKLVKKSKDKGITWGEIQTRVGKKDNNKCCSLLLILSMAQYIATYDQKDQLVYFDQNAMRIDPTFRSFCLSKGNELLEKRSLDFWRWSIPLFTSIAALAISIIALIKGQ